MDKQVLRHAGERSHVFSRPAPAPRGWQRGTRVGAWVSLGVGLAAATAGEAYRLMRERRWLREEVALLPFPVKRGG